MLSALTVIFAGPIHGLASMATTCRAFSTKNAQLQNSRVGLPLDVMFFSDSKTAASMLVERRHLALKVYRGVEINHRVEAVYAVENIASGVTLEIVASRTSDEHVVIASA